MRYTALPTDNVAALRAGGKDANGHIAERSVSDGHGNPCRHCLKEIPKNAEMLILSYRPFDTVQPYAESGPIFLCAQDCTPGGGAQVPDILTTSPDYLVKGYSADERIVYGTGAVVAASDVARHASEIFKDPNVAYAHVRSARNNCYQLRIDRN